MPLDDAKRFVLGMTQSQRIKAITYNGYIFASRYVNHKKVLDAACGSGFGSFFIAHEAKEVMGVDVSIEAINFAKQNYQRSNLSYQVMDIAQKGILPKKYFDIIISILTIEQLSSDKITSFLENCYDALSDDGVFILTTPNKKITSPRTDVSPNKANMSELTKQELIKHISPWFEINSWFGQKQELSIYTNVWVRKMVKFIMKLFGREAEFYGHSSCSEALELRPFRTPMYYTIVARKK